jgi:hypothetical protein
MLLMRRTRSLTSQVSYLAGMIFAAALGGRARLGEEPWLEEEVPEEELLRVTEERCVEAGMGGVVRLVFI